MHDKEQAREARKTAAKKHFEHITKRATDNDKLVRDAPLAFPSQILT